MVEAQQTGPGKKDQGQIILDLISHGKSWVTVESYWKVVEGRM